MKNPKIETTLAPRRATKAEAEKMEEMIRQNLERAEFSLVAAAMKLREFYDAQGWLALGYKSLGEWREARMRYGQFYQLRSVMMVVEKLQAGGATEKQIEAVEEMPLTNIQLLATAMRRAPSEEWVKPKWIEAAKGPIAEFETKVEKVLADPDLHVEPAVKRGFTIGKSCADNWDMALRVAGTVDGQASMEGKVDCITGTYLNAASGKPGKTKLQRYVELEENLA